MTGRTNSTSKYREEAASEKIESAETWSGDGYRMEGAAYGGERKCP